MWGARSGKARRIAATGPISFDGHRLPRLHRDAMLPLTISSFKYPGERERLASRMARQRRHEC